ncbi:hypothetical protein [Halomonas binhaiensis]|uniref:Uncharacterized protein n=1 Tax=Halomonas binhaiensis TaxID=2562282 RepID=A0A5C1NBQ0_9GAMM|nr:hypothetical protein [Halomonas binhaiensis]QEM80786.1 hypothetical protein E4T21_03865 [Halomonas binhaiensis]
MISFKHLLPISLSSSDESFVIKKHILGHPDYHLQGLYIYRDHSLYRILSFEWGDEADVVKRLILQHKKLMNADDFNTWFDGCFPETIMQLSRKQLELIFQHRPTMIRDIFRRRELHYWDMTRTYGEGY